MSKSSAPTAATPSTPSVARAGWRTGSAANPTAFIVWPAGVRCGAAAPRTRPPWPGAQRHGNRGGGERHVSADAHEDERGVVSPLEERVDQAFGQDRQHQAERCTRPGDNETLDQHLDEDPARGQADEAKDADCLAPARPPA